MGKAHPCSPAQRRKAGSIGQQCSKEIALPATPNPDRCHFFNDAELLQSQARCQQDTNPPKSAHLQPTVHDGKRSDPSALCDFKSGSPTDLVQGSRLGRGMGPASRVLHTAWTPEAERRGRRSAWGQQRVQQPAGAATA